MIAEDKSALSVSVYFLLATQMIPPCQRKISYNFPLVPKTPSTPSPPYICQFLPFPSVLMSWGADSSNGAFFSSTFKPCSAFSLAIWEQAGTTCGASSQPDLIQNHFLIARMLRFLRHSRQKVPYFNISRQKVTYFNVL